MDNQSTHANDTSTDGYNAGLGTNAKIIMYSIVLVLSVIGNGLVIAVVGGNKHLRTVFNSFIVNMAVSDLFIPLLAMPIKIIETANGKPAYWLIDGALGNATCKLFIFLIDISPAVSVSSLVIIAVNRFIAIVTPMYHAGLFSARRCKILIAFTWIAATVIFSPYFYTYRISNDGYTSCRYEWSPPFGNRKSGTIFFSIIIAVFFVVPFILITLLYTIIIFRLYKDSKMIVQMLSSQEALNRKQRNKHIFYISVAMIVAFAVFWGPFFVILFMQISSQKFDAQPVTTIVQYLGYANSVVNPCIYFIFLRTFRNGFKRLFCRCLKKETNGLPNHDTRLMLLTKDSGNVDRIRQTKMTTSV